MKKELLHEMIRCISPSGKEEMLQKCVYNTYKNDFDSFVVGNQGTLTGIKNDGAPFRIMLAGHADEISLIVTGYNSDGSLQVASNGGIKPKLYIGAKVQILTPNGVLKGVGGVNDTLNGKDKVAADALFIDCGFESEEEAKAAVPKGSYIVHDTDMVELANDKLAGRAFDDRIGVYVVFEAAKKAIEMGAKSCILCTATTGEETTGRGAFSSAATLHPDVCVAVDVTYATDHQGPDEPGDVKLGKGGVITRGSIPNARLNALLEECAKELNLPLQEEVWGGRTYTDADTMLQTNEGVTQVLFSIPLRYMHSPVEVLSAKDVDSMVDILALFLVKLDENYSLAPYTLD